MSVVGIFLHYHVLIETNLDAEKGAVNNDQDNEVLGKEFPADLAAVKPEQVRLLSMNLPLIYRNKNLLCKRYHDYAPITVT